MLYTPNRSVTRLNVQRLLLLCVLRLFPIPLVLPSRAGVDPTAHIILCASALASWHSVVIGHRACPAPRTSNEPTAQRL